MIRSKIPAGRSFLLAAAVLAALAWPLEADQSKPHHSHASRLRQAAKAQLLKTRPAAEGSRYVGEPISLDLKDADRRDVLRTFAELTGVNIVIDPEVKGSVTVRLHDVPWDQALDVILRINGLGYVLENKILRVGLPRTLLSGS